MNGQCFSDAIFSFNFCIWKLFYFHSNLNQNDILKYSESNKWTGAERVTITVWSNDR